VKRRRSSAPGRLRPDGRWTRSLLLAGLLGLALSACGQATSTESPASSPDATSEPAPGQSETIEPSAVAPSDGPKATTDPTTPEPAATPSGDSSADPSSGTGSAARCSGSDENRDFFASMAAAVDWTVFCPVVGDGWFVEDGQYRLANGGWMEISYDGPGDARIVLRQGSFCDTGDGCVPAGSDVGDTAFGDRNGSMIAAIDGSWVVVVDRGATPTWLLAVHGLDEAAARAIAADMHAVAG